MAILNDVKKALRISDKNTKFDDDLTDIVAAAKLDLKGAGVIRTDDTDALIKRAIIIYAKANFGLGINDMEKYQKSFDKLKIHLSLSADYNTKTEV